MIIRAYDNSHINPDKKTEDVFAINVLKTLLDLDDGVKANYRKLQTASDGKFYEVLADSGNIMGKK